MSHDEMHELLAGYVLRSLSGEDAAEADRILIDHVPGCEGCRATLDAFQAVAGELALDAHPLAPPDTLRVRLGRELEPRTRLSGRWSSWRIVAFAASVVLVVGIGGLVLTQRGNGGMVAGDGLARADLQAVTDAATSTGAVTTDLGEGQAKEISSPEMEELFIYGTDVQRPPPGTVYALWALPSSGQASYVGEFLPNDDGSLLLEVRLDARTVDSLYVSIELAGSTPTTPGTPAWPAAA
jgi:anti-sigma-K factor RskA